MAALTTLKTNWCKKMRIDNTMLKLARFIHKMLRKNVLNSRQFPGIFILEIHFSNVMVYSRSNTLSKRVGRQENKEKSWWKTVRIKTAECYRYKSEKTFCWQVFIKEQPNIHIKYNLLASPSAKTINVKRAKAEIINKRYFTVNALNPGVMS